MSEPLAQTLTELRVAVGMLGERASTPWWKTSFFGSSSQAFLAPTFPRTVLAAQFHGVREAASRVHDGAIGTGHVYHLFRLPEDLEQALHRQVCKPDRASELTGTIKDEESAVATLEQHSKTGPANGQGPVRVGGLADIRSSDAWRRVAGLYLVGYKDGRLVLPYFAES